MMMSMMMFFNMVNHAMGCPRAAALCAIEGGPGTDAHPGPRWAESRRTARASRIGGPAKCAPPRSGAVRRFSKRAYPAPPYPGSSACTHAGSAGRAARRWQGDQESAEAAFGAVAAASSRGETESSPHAGAVTQCATRRAAPGGGRCTRSVTKAESRRLPHEVLPGCPASRKATSDDLTNDSASAARAADDHMQRPTAGTL